MSPFWKYLAAFLAGAYLVIFVLKFENRQGTVTDGYMGRGGYIDNSTTYSDYPKFIPGTPVEREYGGNLWTKEK